MYESQQYFDFFQDQMWQDDREVTECQRCENPFTLARRKVSVLFIFCFSSNFVCKIIIRFISAVSTSRHSSSQDTQRNSSCSTSQEAKRGFLFGGFNGIMSTGKHNCFQLAWNVLCVTKQCQSYARQNYAILVPFYKQLAKFLRFQSNFSTNNSLNKQQTQLNRL